MTTHHCLPTTAPVILLAGTTTAAILPGDAQDVTRLDASLLASSDPFLAFLNRGFAFQAAIGDGGPGSDPPM